MTVNQRVPLNRYIVFLTIAVVGTWWDLASKTWVFAALGYPHRQSDWNFKSPFLWGQFSCELFTSFNQGGLWGMAQGWSWLFAIIAVFASGGLLYAMFIRKAALSWWLTVFLGLIMAGILGNLYDRLYLHGCVDELGRELLGVRDFIHCTIPLIQIGADGFKLIPEYDFPVFNFADAYLVTGAIALTIYTLFLAEDPKPEPQSAAGTSTEPTAAIAGQAAAGQIVTPPTASVAPSVAGGSESAAQVPPSATGEAGK